MRPLEKNVSSLQSLPKVIGIDQEQCLVAIHTTKPEQTITMRKLKENAITTSLLRETVCVFSSFWFELQAVLHRFGRCGSFGCNGRLI